MFPAPSAMGAMLPNMLDRRRRSVPFNKPVQLISLVELEEGALDERMQRARDEAFQAEVQQKQMMIHHMLNLFWGEEDVAIVAISWRVHDMISNCRNSFTLDDIHEELLHSCESFTNRLLNVHLRFGPSDPDMQWWLVFRLPSTEAYKVNPTLRLKDQIAWMMRDLLRECSDPSATMMIIQLAMDHMTRVNDEGVLAEVLSALQTWPLIADSVEWSRILAAEQILGAAVPKKAPKHSLNSNSALKKRISDWLMANGHGDATCISRIQGECQKMLQSSLDDLCLSNLQWGLSRWPFMSRVAFFRLRQAKAFLQWHSTS